MGKSQSKVPHIPKEDLDYLLKKTTITAKEIKHWYRIYMRECPSGQLTKEQFCKIYAEITPSKQMNPLYEHIFRTYDQDNSGHIDFTEFIQAINITRSSKPEDKLRMAFRLYDIDQNGCIEEKEMVEVMKALYIYANDRTTIIQGNHLEKKALYTMAGGEMNTDIDGRIRARAKRVFELVDNNHDGYVTVDELVNVCMRNPDVYNMVISTSRVNPKKKA